MVRAGRRQRGIEVSVFVLGVVVGYPIDVRTPNLELGWSPVVEIVGRWTSLAATTRRFPSCLSHISGTGLQGVMPSLELGLVSCILNGSGIPACWACSVNDNHSLMRIFDAAVMGDVWDARAAASTTHRDIGIS